MTRASHQCLKSSPLVNTEWKVRVQRALTDLRKVRENSSVPLCVARRLSPREASCHGPTARCGPAAWADLRQPGRPQTCSLSPITSSDEFLWPHGGSKTEEKKNLNVDIYWCYYYYYYYFCYYYFFFKWVGPDGRVTPVRNDAQCCVISVTLPPLFSDKRPGLFQSHSFLSQFIICEKRYFSLVNYAVRRPRLSRT